jgi:hypothetical protein
LKDKVIQNLSVAGFGICNVDKNWNRTLNVDHGVKFYSAFATSEVSPWKQGQAQINGSRIQCVNGVGEVEPEISPDVKRSGRFNEALGEIGVDSPVATFVGIGQTRPFDQRMKPGMVEPLAMGVQADNDIAETLTISQLRERHCQKLFPTRQVAHTTIAVVTSNATAKDLVIDKGKNLREYRFSLIHAPTPQNGCRSMN